MTPFQPSWPHPDRKAEAMVLWKEGMLVANIVTAVGAPTRSAVISAMRKMGAGPHPNSTVGLEPAPDQLEKLAAAIKAGASIKGAADSIGMNRETARRYCDKLGLVVARPRPAGSEWTPEKERLVQEHFDAGMGGAESARILGVTKSALNSKRDRMGLKRSDEEVAEARRRAARAGNAASRERKEPNGPKTKALPGQPPAPFVPRVVFTESLNVDLHNRSDDGCKYPTAEDADGRQLFCGLTIRRWMEGERVRSSAYCLDHDKLCIKERAPLSKKLEGNQLFRAERERLGRRFA